MGASPRPESTMSRCLRFAFALFLLFASAAYAEDAPKTYYVLLHSPGPHWNKAKSFREQPGIQAHIAYMGGFDKAGKLVIGGPFLDNTGGLMVLEAASLDEAKAEAMADPTVKSGLLKVTVHPWLVAFQR
jgi:uncharacterized protein YciI